MISYTNFTTCRSKLERNKDRDISEKIALGMPSGAPSQDSLFDQRLFNQSKVSSSLIGVGWRKVTDQCLGTRLAQH